MRFNDEEKIKQIENEISEKDLINYEENRKKGENNSHICSLIRQDSVEEFIAYVNQLNIPLSSQITHSIFETNSFLIKNKPTLIEYSIFYGSIKILIYLLNNKTELTSSLWLYAIHSNNDEIIGILEENKIEPKNGNFLYCYLESIKCHHNNIATYIKEKYLNNNEIDNEDVVSYSFKYSNYTHFPNDFDRNSGFFNLCFYNYSKIVDIFLSMKEESIKAEII